MMTRTLATIALVLSGATCQAQSYVTQQILHYVSEVPLIDNLGVGRPSFDVGTAAGDTFRDDQIDMAPTTYIVGIRVVGDGSQSYSGAIPKVVGQYTRRAGITDVTADYFDIRLPGPALLDTPIYHLNYNVDLGELTNVTATYQYVAI